MIRVSAFPILCKIIALPYPCYPFHSMYSKFLKSTQQTLFSFPFFLNSRTLCHCLSSINQPQSVLHFYSIIKAKISVKHTYNRRICGILNIKLMIFFILNVIFSCRMICWTWQVTSWGWDLETIIKIDISLMMEVKR